MDTNELKKLLKGSTAILILDNGDPSFVVLGYEAYKNLLSGQEKEIKINHPEVGGNNQFANPVMIKNGFTNESVSKFQHRVSEKESEFLEKLNKEIMSLKNEIEREEKGSINPQVD